MAIRYLELVQLLLDDLIASPLQKLDFHVAFLKAYVDDTILAISCSETNEIFSVVNSYNLKLKFTTEEEHSSQI